MPLVRTPVNPEEVIYLTSEINYTWIHFRNGTAFLSSYTLSALAPLFPGFTRIRNSVLINPDCAVEWNWWNDGNRKGRVVMSDGSRWPVAKGKVAELRNANPAR